MTEEVYDQFKRYVMQQVGGRRLAWVEFLGVRGMYTCTCGNARIYTHSLPPTCSHTNEHNQSTNQVDRGALRLDLLFASSLEPLGQAFEETGYKGARTDLVALKQAVKSEVGRDPRFNFREG